MVRLLAEKAAPLSFEMRTLLLVVRPWPPKVLLPLLLLVVHPLNMTPERLLILRSRLPTVSFTVLPSLI